MLYLMVVQASPMGVPLTHGTGWGYSRKGCLREGIPFFFLRDQPSVVGRTACFDELDQLLPLHVIVAADTGTQFVSRER